MDIKMSALEQDDFLTHSHDTSTRLITTGLESSASGSSGSASASASASADLDKAFKDESLFHQNEFGIPSSSDQLSNSVSNSSLNLSHIQSTNLSLSSELYTALPGGGVILKRGMACTFCRRRKLRCSAERPSCANCVRYSQTCEYLAVNAGRGNDGGDDIDPPYTNMFTDAPLPPASDRPVPPGAIMGQRRRPSLQTKGSDSWSRRGSVATQKTPTKDRRPSLARNASASTSTIPLLSPTAPPPPSLFQFEQNHHGLPTSFGEHVHGHGQPYPSTSTWVPPPPLTSHDSGSVLTSPSIHQPTPMSFHYEQVAPVPPPIQYPAEDETAWYQAALNVDPQQQQPSQAYPSYQQTPPHPQDPYHVNPTPQYPAYEGYQDLVFGSTGVPGVGARYTEPIDHQTMNHAPGSSTIYSEPGYESGTIHQSTSTYAHTPGPYASQANLAIQTTPMTIPIYHTHYSTPSVDMEGHRPGMMHEGTYSGMGYQENGYMSPSISHPALYQEDNQNHSTHLHHVQPAPYTFPHLPIPLPEYERPTIPRSASNPNNTMHLSSSEPPSEGSVPTTTTTTVSVTVPEGEYYPQNMNVCYPDGVSSTPGSGAKKIDKLTERLGEFFLGPEKKKEEEAVIQVDGGGERHIKKARRSVSGNGGGEVFYGMQESDGLTEVARNALLDVFFEHHRLFFDFSVSRFKSRLTLHDRRRPSLALLNAMYMWATRMSHSPNMPSTETHFYQQAIVHLDASAATGDKLMDCIRAAYLLSAFQYMNGRHHSGYLLCGHSAQLVKSCGLHRIPSTVFSPAPAPNPFLRNRPYLLPPPEDALELGERIHTFWAVLSLDRSSSALTGFMSSFRDSDITTPWPRELSDIASGMVTLQDDVTLRDLYRSDRYQHTNERSYVRWNKAVVILERASKLVLLDPEDASEHTRQWTIYKQTGGTKPPGYLESPRYRTPTEFEETKSALETLIRCCGEDGVFPVDKKLGAELDGREEVVISPAVILFHHVVAATQTLLYDTNSLDAEYTEALIGARRAVALIKELPPLPIHAVDAFAPLTWVMVAKVLIKEMYRLKQNGDGRYKAVEEEVQCLIDEINRVGTMMPPSRMYAKGVEDLLRYASAPPTPPSQGSSSSYSNQSQSQPSSNSNSKSTSNSNTVEQPMNPQSQWDNYPTNQSHSFIHDMSR